MQHDFVSVGDITTDAFIELKDARVNCDIDDQNCQLCVRFGDKIPYEEVIEVRAVGNSPNAAVSAHRLGLNSALITDIGSDRNGQDCMDALTEEGVNTEFVRKHEDKTTNYHYVLRYEAERTILIKHEHYEYKLPKFAEPPRWMYLSSVGENSLDYQLALAEYVKANGVKLAFQPGTFQMSIGVEPIKPLYEASEIFFCNKEESQRILKTKEANIHELLKGVRELGPNIAVITDGPKGAYASDGTGTWYVPMYPDPAPPVDRTGAGDATSSTITAFLALGLPLSEALPRGPINSMNVVQYVGAQKGLLTREKLEELLANAPADYKVQQLA